MGSTIEAVSVPGVVFCSHIIVLWLLSRQGRFILVFQTDRVLATQRGVQNQRWAVTSAVISFAVAILMIVLHILPTGMGSVVGSKLEGIFSLLMILNSCMLVSLVSTVTNGLAVDTDGGVMFGNLYYFSWAAFGVAFLILLDYFKGVYGWEMTEQLRSRSSRLDLWLTFLVCNLIMMASASNVYDYMCVSLRTKMLCNRTLLAIIMSVTGTVFSIIIVGMKGSAGFAPLVLEAGVCVVLFLANCFAIALVTSEFGPGAKIGNLYYSQWGVLLVSFVLVASCHEDYMASKDEQIDELSRFYDNEDDGMTYAGRSVANRSVAGKSFAERSYVGTKAVNKGKGGKYDEATIAGETATMSMWT
jgi:hypothetical protein